MVLSNSIEFEEIAESQYGLKLIMSVTRFNGITKDIKDTNWEKTHYKYHPKRKLWSIDATKESFEEFEKKTGEDIPSHFKSVIRGEGSKVTITVTNKKCYIQNADDDLLDYLYQSLSYIPKEEKISGNLRHDRLFSRSTKSFPPGLIYRVINTLEEVNIDYEVINKKKESGEIDKKIDTGWNFDGELRDYQEEAFNIYKRRGNGLINLPCGTGKTLLALRTIHEVNRPTIIIVHRKKLMDQWIRRIRNTLGVEPGVIGDNEWNPRLITIAMVQTLIQRDTPKYDYNLVVIDECHIIPADESFKAVKDIQPYRVLGLTATPWRDDGKDMKIEALTGKIIYSKKPKFHIERGELAKPIFEYIDHKTVCSSDNDNWHEEEENYIVKNHKRNDLIGKKAAEMVREGRKTLVDIHRVNPPHGELIADRIESDGVERPPVVHGETDDDEQDRLIKEFKESDEPKILISTLLEEGIDIPDISAIILAGGRKSSVKIIQTIGRALRPEGKDTSKVIDCVDRGENPGKHFKKRQEHMEKYYKEYFTPYEG